MFQQGGAGRRWIGGGTDQGNQRIQIRQRHRQPFNNVGAFASLAQIKHGAPHHHFTAMAEKGFQHLLEIEQARLPVHQRHHVDAKHAL